MNDTSAPALMPDTINRHLDSVYPALAMMAGMQLEVFSVIGDQALDVDQIAHAMAVKPNKLRPLLYALVTAGLLSVDDGRFANGAEAAEFLAKGKPRYIGGLHSTYADLWSATLHTAASIRSGVPQARHDFAAMNEDELNAFVRGLDAGAGAAARRLHKSYDMNRFSHLLDAGGGSGALAVELLGLCPQLCATVAELGNVAPVTRACLAEAELGSRVTVIEADLVHEVPAGGYDVVVLRAVLQVLSESDAARVLSNCATALNQGGELFVFGRVLDDSRLAPLETVAVNVMFLNVYENGQAYTESEYRAWFAAAGLEAVTRLPIGGGYSIMTGVKPRA